MYFNSFEFIFLFLPLTLLVFIMINKSRFNHYNLYWLITVSLFFYGWWNIKYLLLILFSIFINFIFGKLIRKIYSKFILIVSITANLLILGYYKYFNFFADTDTDTYRLINWYRHNPNIYIRKSFNKL